VAEGIIMKQTRIEWSEQQLAAQRRIKTWRADASQQVFRLFGYAGTGKTELARSFADDDRVMFAAYTGKAAHVLSTRIGKPAATIHRTIYQKPEKVTTQRGLNLKERKAELNARLSGLDIGSHPKIISELAQIERELAQLRKHTNLRFELKDPDDCELSNANLLVVDEVSMVDERLGRDLLSFDIPILGICDLGQLQPIKGGGFFTNADPDFMLDEIHRQSAGNPIIELAGVLRGGRLPNRVTIGETSVVGVSEISDEMLIAADTVIVGRNNTRRWHNKRIRRLLHENRQLQLDLRRPEWPIVGDKIICKHNRYDERGDLYNGSMWQIREIEFLSSDNIDVVFMRIKSIDGDEREIDAIVPLSWFLETEFEDELEDDNVLRQLGLDAFKFGYSITCHSAQGSQWENVIVIDEGFCWRKERWCWRYTAATRAINKLTFGL
jgi:exodeoxyribonuclease V